MAPPMIAAVAASISAGAGVVGAIKAGKQMTLPKPPEPPSQDTAANAANQQALLMRRRRGVLSNIFAGNQNTNTGATGGGATQLGG